MIMMSENWCLMNSVRKMVFYHVSCHLHMIIISISAIHIGWRILQCGELHYISSLSEEKGVHICKIYIILFCKREKEDWLLSCYIYESDIINLKTSDHLTFCERKPCPMPGRKLSVCVCVWVPRPTPHVTTVKGSDVGRR